MSFDSNNNYFSSSETVDENYSTEPSHLSIVKSNETSDCDPMEELNKYFQMVNDSVNMLFLTAILEKKVKKHYK